MTDTQRTELGFHLRPGDRIRYGDGMVANIISTTIDGPDVIVALWLSATQGFPCERTDENSRCVRWPRNYVFTFTH